MSSEEKDMDLPVASEDKQTVVFCTKCGKEFDLYNELLEDHKFMCSSDFPDFEVKEKSHIKYIEKSDAEEAIQEARKTKEIHFSQVILEAEQRGIISADQAHKINDLRDELEEEVEES